MNPRTAKLLEGPILRSLLSLAVPIVGANLLQSAYQLTDAFWVGRLGGAAVAAVSVSFPVIFLMIALGGGLAVAGSTLIAQYAGAGNQRMVNHVAAQTLLMVVIASLLLGAAAFLLAPSILRLLGVAAEVHDAALGFMRVSFVGLVFLFGFIMFQAIMRGIGEVRVPVFIVLGTVLLNFVLDPLFIFGWGPIAGQGVMGAALATLATQGLAAAAGLFLLFRGRHGIQLRPGSFRPDPAYIARAFRLGFPASVEQSARALGLMVMTFLITSFGTLTLAAYGVGSNVLRFVIIPALGLSMAISTLVGQNIGAGNRPRAAAIARLGALLAFGALSLVGLLAFLFAPQLVAFFVPDDPAVIEHGAEFLRIVAPTFGFIGLQFALTGVFRAAGNMLATMVIALVAQWVLQFPLAYILSKHTTLGAEGLWWAFPVANVTVALISVAWYRRGDWQRVRLTEEDRLAGTVSDETLIGEGVQR